MSTYTTRRVHPSQDSPQLFDLINRAYSCDQGKEGIQFLQLGRNRFSSVGEVERSVGGYLVKDGSVATSEFLVVEELDTGSTGGMVCGCIGLQMVLDCADESDTNNPKSSESNAPNPLDPYLYFSLLAVKPECQGRGIGKLLMDSAREWFVTVTKNLDSDSFSPNTTKSIKFRCQTLHLRSDLWRPVERERVAFDDLINETVLAQRPDEAKEEKFKENSLFGSGGNLVCTRVLSRKKPNRSPAESDASTIEEVAAAAAAAGPSSSDSKSLSPPLVPFFRLTNPINGYDNSCPDPTTKIAYKGYRCIGVSDGRKMFPVGDGNIATREVAWITLEKEIESQP